MRSSSPVQLAVQEGWLGLHQGQVRLAIGMEDIEPLGLSFLNMVATQDYEGFNRTVTIKMTDPK